MNIFKAFVLSRPVKTPLDFGYNNNIVIDTIDFGVRKKNGIAINANTFIRLAKIDPKDKSIKASTEINFWNLDPTKDFVYSNFISQFTILYGIIDAIGGDCDVFESTVLDVLEGDTEDATLKFLKAGDNAKTIQQITVDAFKLQVTDKIGLDSTLLKCKMISNKQGFLDPGAEVNWILPMSSEEALPVISSREKFIRKTALETNTKKTAKPDSTGKAPASGSNESAPTGAATVAANALDSI